MPKADKPDEVKFCPFMPPIGVRKGLMPGQIAGVIMSLCQGKKCAAFNLCQDTPMLLRQVLEQKGELAPESQA